MATVAIAQHASAQYSQDAIRFSGAQTGATSRIKALGNANVAVGGDLTSIGGNPAGLGFFTRSELSITPEFNMNKVGSDFLGQNSKSSRNDANLNNASVVFYSQVNKGPGESKSTGWLSVNFGASYNRTNNFYQKTYYSGVNPTSSIADYYATLGNIALDNNYSLNGYLEGWAQAQKLIYLNSSGNYEATTTLEGTQSNTVVSSGGQSDLNFSFGANYSNKLYIGAGFGLTSLRYNTTSNFVEDNFQYISVNKDFVSNYTRDQVTRGNGFNGRIGLIYKPVETVRIGATLTTPTWYTIDDNSGEGLSTRYQGGDNYRANDGYSSSYPSTYLLRTPLKVAGGIAVFAGKYGFITGDIEYMDYSSTKLSNSSDNDNPIDFTQDNNDIKRLYKSAVNLRFGAEARLVNSFFLRGGYGIQGSPFKDGAVLLDDTDGNKHYGKTTTVSGGLGYRFKDYYIDATYMHLSNNTKQYPYEYGDLSPDAKVNNRNNNVFLTVGLRF